MKRTLVAAAAGSLLLAGLTVPTLASTGSKAPVFDAPVLLTTDKMFGGYEPAVMVTHNGTIVVTAHKQNHNLVVSPDSRSASGVRSMSWIWSSGDGRKFQDMPGLTPVQEQNQEFGDEGDIAYDEKGGVYFVDTNVTDNSFTRWRTTQRGHLTLETTRPVGPFGEPVDDRPWIAAHGDGVVAYIGNEGDKGTYPVPPLLPTQSGTGVGPGRYTVYMSYDGGTTFDPLGVQLKDSGWCRPAADHRKGSKRIVVLCGDDGAASFADQAVGSVTSEKGTLYSYLSEDDGKTWNRFTVGSYHANDPWATYPSVTIGKDGTMTALYLDHTASACSTATSTTFGCGAAIKSSSLKLYTSKDGKHWKGRDITPASKPKMRYSWVDVAPNGTVGVVYYAEAPHAGGWFLTAATASGPTKAFTHALVTKHRVASSDLGTPLGDFFTAAFDPQSRLNVVWTSLNDDVLAEGLNSDIYFARQR